MRWALVFAVVLATAVIGLSISGQEKELNNLQRRLYGQANRLSELHSKMGPLQAGDWLTSHDESGQTFAQYLRSAPVRVSTKRNTLYVLPLGDFDENQKRIVDLSAEFLGLYFCCKVETLAAVALDDAIPGNARRVTPPGEYGKSIRNTFCNGYCPIGCPTTVWR